MMNIENEILPQGPFTKQQHAFLRYYDACIASLAVLAAAITLFVIPFGSFYYGGHYGDDVDTYITIGIIVAVLTFCAGSVLLFMASNEQRAKDDTTSKRSPFMMSLIALGVIWLMSIPWAFIYLADDAPLLHALFGAPIAIVLGMLFGGVAWCLGAVPIALLVRGLVRLITKKEAATLVPMIMACILISMGSLIVLGPMAIDTGSLSGRAAAILGLSAMLGFSGDYTIANETAFEVGRWMTAASVVFIVAYFVLRAYFKKTK